MRPARSSWRSCTTAQESLAGARIAEAHRLHRPESERLAPARGHLLHRHAALEVRHLVELMAVILVGGEERVEEGVVLLARTSGNSGTRPRRRRRPSSPCRSARRGRRWHRRWNRARSPARSRRRRRATATPSRVRIACASASEVSGPVAMMPAIGISVTSPRSIAMSRMRGDAVMHGLREDLAVDRERAAAGNARLIGAQQDERAEPAHLGLEQAVRVRGLGALEGVRADELGELVGLVRGGRARTGRISWSTTRTPRSASCQAASLPARPPPTT